MGPSSMGGSGSSIPIPTSALGGAAGAKRGSRASIPTADDKKPAAAFGGAGPARGSVKEPEVTLSPQVNALHNKWRHVWLMSMDRRRKLQVSGFSMKICKVGLSASVSPYGMMLGRRRFFITQGLEGKELVRAMSSLASHVTIAVSTGTSEGGNDEGIGGPLDR